MPLPGLFCLPLSATGPAAGDGLRATGLAFEVGCRGLTGFAVTAFAWALPAAGRVTFEACTVAARELCLTWAFDLGGNVTCLLAAAEP